LCICQTAWPYGSELPCLMKNEMTDPHFAVPFFQIGHAGAQCEQGMQGVLLVHSAAQPFPEAIIRKSHEPVSWEKSYRNPVTPLGGNRLQSPIQSDSTAPINALLQVARLRNLVQQCATKRKHVACGCFSCGAANTCMHAAQCRLTNSGTRIRTFDPPTSPTGFPCQSHCNGN
jgi:hypothetical protein